MYPKNNNRAHIGAGIRWGGLICLCANAALAQTTVLTAPGNAQVLPPVPPAVHATAAPAETKEEDSMPTSLFFSSDDELRLANAVNIYKKNLEAEATNAEKATLQSQQILEEFASAKEVPKTFTYPQFFLEFLVYHTPSDWYVRVNGQEMRPDKSQNSGNAFSIVNVTNDKVLFKWKPVDMKRVLDVWEKAAAKRNTTKETSNQPIKMDFSANSASDRMADLSVSVNRDEKTVLFTLHPNQTFSSYAMRAFEGKLMPVTVENTFALKQDGLGPVKKSPVDSAFDNASGLNALMKTIE